MFYKIQDNTHGLPHDPFKAIVAPRPIGWISSISRSGDVNLAPYSFFNAISDAPPMVMISSNQRKDTLINIEETGEFVCSLATRGLSDAMNMSSAPVKKGVDEFKLAELQPAKSTIVGPPRVASSPAALECRLWKVISVPQSLDSDENSDYNLILGFVVGVYIDDQYLVEGLFDTARAGVIARMGYMDYCHVSSENTFTLNRPQTTDDKMSATLASGPWDGVYR